MLDYRTVAQEVSSEIVIKKSRFLAHVKPVQNEEEAYEFIRHIQKIHREATHNVYAYRINNQLEKSCDDGEPSGTAGRPVLNVLKGENLYNTVVVVTRYYGGILLGAGGLVRAYSQAASQGLAEAQMVTRVLCQQIRVIFPMPLFGIVKKEIEKFGAKILDVQVTDQGAMVARLPVPQVVDLVAALMEISAGKAVVESLEQEFI